MADDTVYTISVHEGSAKSWAIGRLEMLGSNSLNELAAVLCESMLPKAGRPDDCGVDEHMWKFEVCRREWERDDDFRPASRPASQHSTTTQLASLLARPKHALVVGGDEPFTFLYDYGTQSRLELRVVSAKPKPRISNAALAGAPGTNLAAAALRLLQPEPYPRIAYFDNDAVATGRRIGLDEKYPTFAKAFLDPLHSSTLGLSSMTRSEDNGTFASIESSPFGFGDVLYAPCYFTSGAEFLAAAEAGLKELEEDRSTGPPCDHCALVFPATMGSIDGAEERYAKAAAAAPSGDGLHYRLKRAPRDTLGVAAAYPETHKRLFGGRTFRWISYRANVLRVVAGRGGGEDNRGPPADGRVLREWRR